MKWPMCKIGDIFDVARGGSPRPIQDYLTADTNGLNWIMISDAVEGSKYISITKRRIKPEGLKKTRMVYEGDFLLTNSMSFGHPYILKTSGCIHDGWLVLSPQTREIFPDFFYYLLGSETLYRQFSKLAAGAVVKNLKTDIVKGVPVPVPPLAEQKRIAAILDAADALRAKRREALAQLDALVQSMFLEMFGDPVTNPKGWEAREVESICRLVRGSSPRPKGDKRFYGGPVPRLMVGDITRDGFWVTPQIDSLTEEGAKKSRPVPAETVVMAVSGDVGVVATVQVPCCIHDGFVAFLDLDTETFDPRFFMYQFHSLKVTHERRKAGAIFQNLTTKDIKAMQLPIPPLEKQRRFAAVVESIEQQKALQLTHLAELDALFASLQHRAFSGELSASDGDDPSFPNAGVGSSAGPSSKKKINRP